MNELMTKSKRLAELYILTLLGHVKMIQNAKTKSEDDDKLVKKKLDEIDECVEYYVLHYFNKEERRNIMLDIIAKAA